MLAQPTAHTTIAVCIKVGCRLMVTGQAKLALQGLSMFVCSPLSWLVVHPLNDGRLGLHHRINWDLLMFRSTLWSI
eukprot:scaffold160832_cov23-Prasinocladus_malaysianus.AAC.1